MNRTVVLACAFLFAACGSDQTNSSASLSKDDARALGGKADGSDLCAELGWYGDGVCDEFCSEPDTVDCGDEPVAAECFATGCSSHLCADKDIISTCEFRPEYACLQAATCERQADGACGFTQTDSLSQCLLDVGIVSQPTEQFFSFTPRQCGTNPWEASDVSEVGFAAGELARVQGWLQSQGIEIQEFGFLNSAQPRAVCLACSCARGDRLVVKASSAVAADLEDRGFQALTVGAHTLPIQCGQNPWGGLEALPEENLVASWAKNQGVTLAEIGFLQQVQPHAVCAACSCIRGDRLFVIPAPGADASVLGFEQL